MTTVIRFIESTIIQQEAHHPVSGAARSTAGKDFQLVSVKITLGSTFLGGNAKIIFELDKTASGEIKAIASFFVFPHSATHNTTEGLIYLANGKVYMNNTHEYHASTTISLLLVIGNY